MANASRARRSKIPLTKLRAFTEKKTREIVWSKIERFWCNYV